MKNSDVQKCKAITRKGTPCKSHTMKGYDYCYIHSFGRPEIVVWYKNSKIHLFVAIFGILATIIFSMYSITFGPSRKNQELTIENQQSLQKKIVKISKQLQSFEFIKNPSIEEVESKLDKEIRKAHEGEKKEALKLYSLGQDSYYQNQFEEALSYFSEALQIIEIPAFHFSIGNVLNDFDRQEDAITAFDKVLKIQPNHLGALNNKGIALSDLGRHDEALAVYKKAIVIQPHHLAVLNNMGVAFSDLGRHNEALVAFEKVLDIQPDNATGWNNKGNSLDNLGRQEEAIAAYDKALEIQPDLVKAWYNKGNTLDNLGRQAEAIAAYEKALEIQPDHANAWYSEGNVLKDLGRNNEAIAAYDKALKLQPALAGAWNNKQTNGVKSLFLTSIYGF